MATLTPSGSIQTMSRRVDDAARGIPDRRGNNKDRANRKKWMLKTWGDGTTCSCIHCGKDLTYLTVEADRIVPGGTYARINIQPACHPCNARRGANPNWIYQPKINTEKELT